VRYYKKKELVMRKSLKAVYENGVLRPLEPVELEEHAQVTVRIVERVAGVLGETLRGQSDPTSPEDLEAVRKALSKIPGSLAAAVNAERQDR
jgi:predicted DNA-binding antitoxin AbrB/MazE fold protein